MIPVEWNFKHDQKKVDNTDHQACQNPSHDCEQGVQAMCMVLRSGFYAVSSLLVIATNASGIPMRNPGW